MRRLILAAAAALIPAAAFAAEPYKVGETTMSVHPAGPRYWRGAAPVLPTRIWYPADAALPDAPHDIGPPGRPLFRAHPQVAPGSPIAGQRRTYPLLVLSHGTGGNAETMEWLGAALADAGYIVAAVDHPGNSAMGPMTWDGFSLWWERATDISQMLDAVLADPTVGPRVDRNRIGAVGFSIGGYTVLALAGARTDLDRFLAFCKTPAADATCKPPEMAMVRDKPEDGAPLSAETRESRARSGASYRDPRIKAVFAIAPAVGQTFGRESFAKVTVPVRILAGADDTNVPPPTNAAHIAAIHPAATLRLIPGAAHYTFLNACTPAGTERIGRICQDAPGVDRLAVQQAAIDDALAFFGKTLPAPR